MTCTDYTITSATTAGEITRIFDAVDQFIAAIEDNTYVSVTQHAVSYSMGDDMKADCNKNAKEDMKSSPTSPVSKEDYMVAFDNGTCADANYGTKIRVRQQRRRRRQRCHQQRRCSGDESTGSTGYRVSAEKHDSIVLEKLIKQAGL